MGLATSLEFGQKLGQPPIKDPLHLQTLFSWSQEGRKWEVLLYLKLFFLFCLSRIKSLSP